MFDKIKKALGLDHIEPDALIKDDPEIKSSMPSPFSEQPTRVEPVMSDEDLENTVKEIFKHVVESFNAALPEFFQKTVDPEKEKKHLYDTLNSDVKSYMENLENDVRVRIENQWLEERDKFQSDIKNLSQATKELETQKTEIKAQQLSAERQRRALTDKIKDLENQMRIILAEKEQIELENKSMLNKIKVAQVYENDMEEMRAQITHLQTQLKNKQAIPNSNAVYSEATAKQVNELKSKIEQLEKANSLLTQKNKELLGIKKEHDAFLGKMKQVEKQLIQIDEANSAKDAKLASLRNQLRNAKKEIENTNSLLEKTQDELKKTKSELERLRNTPEKTKNEKQTDRTTKKFEEDDDIFNDTDWIVKTSEKKQKSGTQRSEKIKNKKSSNRDDGQMSLW